MESKKIKVAHIHKDYKFVFSTAHFEGDVFDNTIIIMEKKIPYDGIYKESAILIKDQNINEIIDICHQNELVVFYGLSFISQKIVLALNKEVKIAWRFFGFELYSQLSGLMYSANTLKLKKTNLKVRINHILERFGIYRKRKEKKLLLLAMKKIDLFLGISYEEHIFLKEHFPQLPVFVHLPIRLFDSKLNKTPNRINKLLIGHNNKSVNNHIDILNIIKKNANNNLQAFLLLSYGGETHYANLIKKAACRIPGVQIITDFMSKDDFEQFYKDISAFVINTHRQIAIANVFLAFRNGVKLYINRKNIMYQWLKNEGFLVFSIQDLEHDLKYNNLVLSNSEAEHNMNCYISISKKHTISKFQNEIICYLTQYHAFEKKIILESYYSKKNVHNT